MPNKEFLTTGKIKTAIICFVIFSIAVILYVVINNLSHIGKVPVEIKYAPFEASVFIDNQNYPVNNATNWLELGPHHIMVVLNEFQTLEEDIEITEETKYIYGSLKTQDENNTDLYKKYQADYLQVEGFGGKQSEKEAQKLIEEWPILKHLPYIKNNYALGTMFDEQNNLVITVRAKATQLDNAINKLRSLDESVIQYPVKINDFNNELEGKIIENNNSNPTTFLEVGYQNINLPYQVNEGVYSDDYYYTTISVGKYAGYIPITYRVVLQKKDNSWHLNSDPFPILTLYNTPNVDSHIIIAANQLDAPMAVQPDSSGDGH